MANQSPESSPPDLEAEQEAQETQPRSPEKGKRSRPLYLRYRFWLGLGVTGGAIALGWGAYKLETSLPDSVSPLLTYAREGTVTIESADGVVLQELGPVTHEKLKITEIPDIVTQAFIASEDRRFYEHNGVDYQGILRATLVNLQARDVVEGGSSITQQLARITFLNQEMSLWRKLREMRLAQKIENQFDKEVILERYLNLVYLGSGAYGIGDAAWVYFGKTIDQLTLPEAAMIAGVAPAPSLYSPFENEAAAKQRRNLVLQRMEEDGLITAQEAAEAKAAPLNTKRHSPKRLERKAPYFTEYIQQELAQYVPPEKLQEGGITVETTLNLEWQTLAQETIQQTIEKQGKYQRFEQGALVTLDPRNGHIKTMVGGKDFYQEEEGQFNRVTQAKRQPGSTFKTFVYATAIATGLSPNQGFLDAPYVVDGYQPKNYSDTYRGWVSMRNALINSVNVVAVRALVDVGWNPIIEVAQKMGIESELQPTYSLALGASEVTLLELTGAYGTLANKGIHHQPTGIQRVLDQEGNVIYQSAFSPTRALDEESSAIVTWMLQGVVTSGTGRPAQIGRPVAGKTGTSDDSRDLWFVGYIPQLVTGIWLGNDDNKPTWGASSTAAGTWSNFMGDIVKEYPKEDFPDIPKKLDGREGTIEAEPIKPKQSYYNQRKTASSTSTRNSSRSTRRSYSRPSAPAPSRPAVTTRRNPPRATQPAPSNSSPPANSAPTAPPKPASPPPSASIPPPAPKVAPAPAPAAPAPQPLQLAPPSVAPAPPALKKPTSVSIPLEVEVPAESQP